AKLFMEILNGNGTKAQNNVVCANAAIAINCVHPKRSISECVLLAKESLESKKAFDVYKKLIRF
ncbi:MAG: anthranilate phosphoribosyltransferase, partial [Bacteroidia bacterium]